MARISLNTEVPKENKEAHFNDTNRSNKDKQILAQVPHIKRISDAISIQIAFLIYRFYFEKMAMKDVMLGLCDSWLDYFIDEDGKIIPKDDIAEAVEQLEKDSQDENIVYVRMTKEQLDKCNEILNQ